MSLGEGSVNNLVDADERDDVVRAQIEFLRPTEGRAFSYGYEPAVHEPRATALFVPNPVDIHDARKEQPLLSLNQHGATLVKHRSSVRDLYDDSRLIDVYYPEAAAVIQAATGARRVVVFDHNVRRGLSIPLRPDRYAQGRPGVARPYGLHRSFGCAPSSRPARRGGNVTSASSIHSGQHVASDHRSATRRTARNL